jgi:hypothetical protein
MLQIENTIISLDVIEKKFACNLNKCKGVCCLNGDSGAPLEDFEIKIMELYYPIFKSLMRNEGIELVDRTGVFIIDVEFEKVTPLIEGKDCAFSIVSDGVYWCAIEKAYQMGMIDFQKPISCHLYPIRIKKYPDFDAVNYDKWDICKPALDNKSHQGKPLYIFLKDALVRKYGEDWFAQLDYTAKNLSIKHS